jgi:hypothetical protein
MFPAIDTPSGSDRAVCHTVNGILRMRLLSSLGDFDGDCELYAGLWGEYAGITGSFPPQINQYNSFSGATKKYALYSDSNYIEFDLFNTRANLCQNIYIRLAFMRVRAVVSPDPVPPTRGYIKSVMSGVLLGGDIRI